jgi:4a-hydroxytetrahydrobiopterin dehydratase
MMEGPRWRFGLVGGGRRPGPESRQSIGPEGTAMSAVTAEELTAKKCAPCEGGVPPLSPEEAHALARATPQWSITPDGKKISRHWRVKNFNAGIDFFNKVAALAEEEGHHPDLHLTGYREVTIELTTHAIGGLSENDFILAAKIDRVPIAVKS